MLFSEIKGQNELIERLKRIIDKNRFPHAVLFEGKDGYGNLAVSLAVAQYISCSGGTDISDSCGDCTSCKKYEKLVHPDLHLFFPSASNGSIDKDVESSLYIDKFREFVFEYGAYGSLNKWYEFIGVENKLGVINIRDANSLIKIISKKTFESPYKIIIIWNADKLNTEASNKILKILEEPYPNTFFILTTENKSKIISTILSRVQTFVLSPLSDEVMFSEIKKSDETLTDEKIYERVMQAEGDYNNINMFGSEFEKELHDNFITINRLAIMSKTKFKDTLSFVDTFSKKTREELKYFLSFYLKILNRCYLYNNAGGLNAHPLSFADDKFKANFLKFITNANIADIYSTVEQTRKNIISNANVKMHLVNMIIKLGYCFENK